jgi:hypothetical protein
MPDKVEGVGKTLDAAFEDYAGQKGRGLIEELEGRSLSEALAEFDAQWFTVQIQIQTQPHNQWVKQYKVSDGG